MDRFAHPAMYWVNRLDVGRHRDDVGRHRDGSVSTAMVLKWIACLRLPCMDIAYVTECHTDRARGRYAMTWDGVGMEWLAP